MGERRGQPQRTTTSYNILQRFRSRSREGGANTKEVDNIKQSQGWAASVTLSDKLPRFRGPRNKLKSRAYGSASAEPNREERILQSSEEEFGPLLRRLEVKAMEY